MKFLKLAFYFLLVIILCCKVWIFTAMPVQVCHQAMAQVEQIQVKHFMKIYIFHGILFKMFSFKFY